VTARSEKGRNLRIPSDADQRSELMAITIPNSCRSLFQSDGDPVALLTNQFLRDLGYSVSLADLRSLL
jgi:hypothetical protein